MFRDYEEELNIKNKKIKTLLKENNLNSVKYKLTNDLNHFTFSLTAGDFDISNFNDDYSKIIYNDFTLNYNDFENIYSSKQYQKSDGFLFLKNVYDIIKKNDSKLKEEDFKKEYDHYEDSFSYAIRNIVDIKIKGYKNNNELSIKEAIKKAKLIREKNKILNNINKEENYQFKKKETLTLY